MENYVYVVCLLSVIVKADIYLHNPRGSNNRLNERSATRANNNRLFDSQNNNRGGYNVGDKTSTPSGSNEDNQYSMKFFQSSKDGGKSHLTLEWTNQHGCGGNSDNGHKLYCDIIIQYMCQDDIAIENSKSDLIRDGVNTRTSSYTPPSSLDNEKESRFASRKSSDQSVGYHEYFSWYDKCYVRERNKGLFIADQNLNKNKFGYSSAIHTRQNSQGTRNGYECPEERDYYPYWHPSPWKDAAILTNPDLCEFYQTESFNVKPKYECFETWSDTGNARHYSRWNNEKDCVTNNGKWIKLYNFLEKALKFDSKVKCVINLSNGINYIWGVPYDTSDGVTNECLVPLISPECKEADWTRVNHLGNTPSGLASNFTFILPYFPSGRDKRCVIRIRYNISTADYDRFTTDFRFNQDGVFGTPIENNPFVNVGIYNQPLRLAVNTAQYGRVFQDRTHIFLLRKRPNTILKNNLYNLNVRGKRGNIVQVYPAVEYDFIPNYIYLREDDLVHIQWTGSNTHDNNHPGGDGQTGDDGEGKGGSDRNNLVQIPHRNSNYPFPFESSTIFQNMTVRWIFNGNTQIDSKILALTLASSGYYQCYNSCDNAVGNTNPLDNLLNDAPASFEGVVLQLKKGIYHFMCTRNNNFSNRSQKGSFIVR